MLRIQNLDELSRRDRILGDALRGIQNAINNLAKQQGADPTVIQAAPQAIGAISVKAANGVFDIQITDNSVIGGPHPTLLTYFAEYSTDPNFTNPPGISVHLGPVRNKTVFLGSQTLYWRGYSQFPGSNPSKPVTFGNPPTAVVGGGVAPPTPQASTGTGSSSSSQPGSGYGRARIFASTQ